MNKPVTFALIALAVFLLARKMFAGPDIGEQHPDGGEVDGDVETPSLATIKSTFADLVSMFGPSIARNVERIYRLETRDFQSGQFLRTNSPGMQAAKLDGFPWGWKKRGTSAADFAPLVYMRENNSAGIPSGPEVPFIAFKRFPIAAFYVAQFLKDYGNNGGQWKSTVPAQQASYRAALEGISTRFTDNA